MYLVNGFGIYEKGLYKCKVDSVHTKEYRLWKSMLLRCYHEKYSEEHKTYIDCSVHEGFKYFQDFAKWCNQQKGFNSLGFELDKDLLLKGNKIYSPDLCVFIPQRINKLIVKCNASRGEYPIGVSKHKNRYQAQISIDKKKVSLGYCATADEAFSVYKVAKEKEIRRIAEIFKKDIDSRAYSALISYEVNKND